MLAACQESLTKSVLLIGDTSSNDMQAANASTKGIQSPAAAQKAFTQAVRVAAAAERSDAAAAREEAASAKDALAGQTVNMHVVTCLQTAI